MPTSLAYGKPFEELDVVLVHDNRGAQAILRSMVSSMRIARLRVYDHADKALSDMVADPPNALICVWEMKPMSGYRLVRMIRHKSMKPLSFVPVLAVTAMPTLTMVDRAFTIGATNIVVMPVSPIVLRRRLEWLSHDNREFGLRDDHYVIEGMEEVLEERVRRNGAANVLQRQKAMQEALARRAETAQDMVDRIVNGEVDVDELEKNPAVLDKQALPKAAGSPPGKVTWNSWAMN